MDPIFDLPKDLQNKKKELKKRKEYLDDLINKIDRQIELERQRCDHKIFPETENHYATYCHKCGEMIDTWL